MKVRHPVLLTIALFAILFCVAAGSGFPATYTPILKLKQPATGEAGWLASFNSDFDTIDNYMGSIHAEIDELVSQVPTGTLLYGISLLGERTADPTVWTDQTVSATTNSLAYIIAAASGASVNLRLPPGTYSISNNYTVPANIHLKPDNGALFSIASGKTLTINGPLQAGLYQIFSGSGTVAIGQGSVKEVYPEWWGTNTTPGSTDMTAAVQSAVNCMGDGGKVHLTGTYGVASGILTIANNKVTLLMDRNAAIQNGTGTDFTLKIAGDDCAVLGGTVQVPNNPTIGPAGPGNDPDLYLKKAAIWNTGNRTRFDGVTLQNSVSYGIFNSNGSGLNITRSVFNGGYTNYILPVSTPANNHFAYYQDGGSDNTITDSYFEYWVMGVGSGAIVNTPGGQVLNVRGCTFNHMGQHPVYIASGGDYSIISENTGIACGSGPALTGNSIQAIGNSWNLQSSLYTSGAIASAAVYVDANHVSYGGTGYTTGDIISVNQTGGSGGQCTVTAAGGVVTGLTPLTGNLGTGYASTGSGVGLSTTAVTGGGSNLSVTIVAGNYQSGLGMRNSIGGIVANNTFTGEARMIVLSLDNTGSGTTILGNTITGNVIRMTSGACYQAICVGAEGTSTLVKGNIIGYNRVYAPVINGQELTGLINVVGSNGSGQSSSNILQSNNIELLGYSTGIRVKYGQNDQIKNNTIFNRTTYTTGTALYGVRVISSGKEEIVGNLVGSETSAFVTLTGFQETGTTVPNRFINNKVDSPTTGTNFIGISLMQGSGSQVINHYGTEVLNLAGTADQTFRIHHGNVFHLGTGGHNFSPSTIDTVWPVNHAVDLWVDGTAGGSATFNSTKSIGAGHHGIFNFNGQNWLGGQVD